MQGSNIIAWERLDPKTFEEMISVLISRLNPTVQRIDGAGGDGGRDIQILLPSGLEIYELKSFTGRLDSSRRSQVTRSLRRASAHSPTAWHLVVPIDPTPTELEWFEGLKNTVDFTLHWLGLTWLTEKIALHRDISRYFLDGTNDEVVSILRELNSEQGALTGGIVDAIERLRALSARIAELDPFLGYTTTIDENGQVSVTAIPKYQGAEIDRPVEVQARFTIASDNEQSVQRLKDALDYGIPTVFTAESGVSVEFEPNHLVGLPAGPTTRVEIGPGRPVEPIPQLGFSLAIREPTGEELARIHFYCADRTAGQRGGTLTLREPLDVLDVLIKFDMGDKNFTLTYKYHPKSHHLPNQLLPFASFFHKMRAGRFMMLAIDGQDVAHPGAIDPQFDEEEVESVLKFLSHLDLIQQRCGNYFPIPDELSNDDWIVYNLAYDLFTTGKSRRPCTSMALEFDASVIGALREEVMNGPGRPQWQVDSDLVCNLAGNPIRVGRVRKRLIGEVDDWPDVRGLEPNSTVKLTVRTHAEDQFVDFELLES